MSLTRDTLLEYLAEHGDADVDGVEDETPLFSSGLVDSFAMVGLMMFLEKQTGAKLDPADVSIDNFDTVARILAFVAERKKN